MAWPGFIAQAEGISLGETSTFQQQILEQSEFIAVLYGGVFAVGFILLAGFTLRIQTRPLSWALPLQKLEARPWDWRDAVAILLPLIALQLIFIAGYAWYDPPSDVPAGQTERMMVALQGVLFHWVCFGLILWAMRKRGLRWAEAFGGPGAGVLKNVVAGGLILAGVMPVIIAYNIAAHMIMQWWGLTPPVQEVTRIISSASGWPARLYFVLLASVVAPVVEEMLFRGILLPALARVAGVRPALVMVALLFALVHGLQFPSAVIFFMLSLAFSLAYIYRGNLLAPIVMHALFNSMTMVVLLRM